MRQTNKDETGSGKKGRNKYREISWTETGRKKERDMYVPWLLPLMVVRVSPSRADSPCVGRWTESPTKPAEIDPYKACCIPNICSNYLAPGSIHPGINTFVCVWQTSTKRQNVYTPIQSSSRDTRHQWNYWWWNLCWSRREHRACNAVQKLNSALVVSSLFGHYGKGG